MSQPQQKTRSPFLIFEEALSPLQCEAIIEDASFLFPDVDKNNRPIVTTKHTTLAHKLISEALEDRRDEIQAHYQSNIIDMEPSRVLWANSTVTPVPVCDNSSRYKGNWLRIHNRDVTAVVFLVDFNSDPQFDSDFEVYGGKLEFPTYNFGFNPQRGTMITYPSDPHFTHVISPVQVGHMYMTKTFLSFDTPLLFKPSQFPGTYIDWLESKF